MTQHDAFNSRLDALLNEFGMNLYAKGDKVITEVAIPMELRKVIVVENNRRVLKEVWTPALR